MVSALRPRTVTITENGRDPVLPLKCLTSQEHKAITKIALEIQ